ncbi:Translin [Truncatella angustata]|uniref:Translin n=1 Tax=Truncatella angustata TaxID=152316 RepID=A0A9P8URW3_9PEZI|nr:Translin [Truncatella angustata]KAH6657099.1 Translin [Truncatella angustata]
MPGVKRDYRGNKRDLPVRDVPRNQYTSMFEGFRDELDKHHDRREKIVKVSRDVTALSKKIIFSLQRVRKLNQPIPANITKENEERLVDIKALLSTIVEDVSGIRRHRYNLMCLEEFVEAVSFAHYLEHQELITPQKTQEWLGDVNVPFTPADYIYGVFDLTGEMMRFATTVTALTGAIPTGITEDKQDDEDAMKVDEPSNANDVPPRNILSDLQDVSSMLQLIQLSDRTYKKKKDVMIEQVRKVERVGYGVTVRGNERPKGWMPDMNEDYGGGNHDDDGALE